MNLTQLSAGVTTGLGRSDKAADIPTWINQAIEKLAFRHPFKEWRVSLPVSVTGLLEYTLPVNFLCMRKLRWLSSVDKKTLTGLSEEAFIESYPEAGVTSVSGKPEAYLLVEDKKYWVYPIVITGSLAMHYVKKPASLVNPGDSSDLPYNDLIIDAALLYAAGKLQYQAAARQPIESNFRLSLAEALRLDEEENYRTPVLGAYRAASGSQYSIENTKIWR